MKALLIIITIFLLTSCRKESLVNEKNYIEKTEPISEGVAYDISESSSEGITEHNLQMYIVKDNKLYKTGRRSVTYNLTNAEYIGEFIDEFPQYRLPADNMTANFSIEGKKLYKINDELYVVTFERTIDNKNYIINYQEMEEDKATKDFRIIKIEGNLFSFSMIGVHNLGNDFDDFPEEYDFDKAEYIGDIAEQLDLGNIPTENLTSNIFPVGSEVYKINEFIAIVCHEVNNKKKYSVGRIFGRQY